jgi:hypothetical protein
MITKTLRDKSFLKKLAWINGLGLLIILLGPLLIDPQLKHHADFFYPNNRSYSIIRWLWLFMSIPIGFGTYYFGYGWKKRRWSNRILDIAGPALMLVLPALAISFLFPPERPHFGIIVWTFAYGFVTFFTALYRLDINQQFRRSTRHLERLKATISLWQQITLYSGAGYLAFVIFLVSVASTVAKVMIRDEYQKEQFFLVNMEVAQIMLYSVFIVIGPLNQALKTTQYYIKKLSSRNLK